MAKGRRRCGKITAKKKPKLSSGKGGMLVARISSVRKNQNSNG